MDSISWIDEHRDNYLYRQLEGADELQYQPGQKVILYHPRETGSPTRIVFDTVEAAEKAWNAFLERSKTEQNFDFGASQIQPGDQGTQFWR